MTLVTILIIIAALIIANVWGFAAGKYAAMEESDYERSFFHQGLAKIDKMNNWKAQLRNVGGTDDLDAVFVMALRLVSCGVDPKDLITIDRIGMAVANGDFVPKPINDDEFQASLDKIKETEEKS